MYKKCFCKECLASEGTAKNLSERIVVVDDENFITEADKEEPSIPSWENRWYKYVRQDFNIALHNEYQKKISV